MWEVQLETGVQRRGLGKFLMTLLKLVAKHHQLEWIMLTVLNVRGVMCPLPMVKTQVAI